MPHARPPSRPPSGLRLWALVGALLIAGVLIARAASLGPDLVTDGVSAAPTWTAAPGSITPEAQPTPTATATTSGGIEDALTPQLREVAFRWLDAVLIVSALLFVFGLFALISRMPRAGPAPLDIADPPGLPTPLEVRDRLARSLLVRGALDTTGSPRNAIVRCWAHLEDLGGRAGVPREPAETTAEYVPRLLGLAGVPAGPVNVLADLYREARFSEHDLDEQSRDTAREALHDIAVGLHAGTTEVAH